MSNDYFEFKQFKIYQHQIPMKVSVDGVLIGACADVSNAENILDIGTGTGLLALMCAQRAPKSNIIAIELLEYVANGASLNVENSSFASQIKVVHSSIQQFAKVTDMKFDLIISNPPWFSRSAISHDKDRAVARHDDTLPIDELLFACSALLADKGKVVVIMPSDRLIALENAAYAENLYCCNIVKIRHNQMKAPKRIVATFEREKRNRTEDLLTIKNPDDSYTLDYIELTKQFYLYF